MQREEELAELEESRADLQSEIDAEEDDKRKKALSFGLQELDRMIAGIRNELEEQETYSRQAEIAASPEGRLLFAVADAFQYDYFGEADVEDALIYVKDKLEKQGLRLKVETVDD